MNAIPAREIKEDALARKVTRFLIRFQVGVFVLGLILVFLHLSEITLLMAVLSLAILLGGLAWYFIRYRSYPASQLKGKLTKLAASFQAQILASSRDIEAVKQNQEQIEKAEQAERSQALQDLQRHYIDSSMAGTLVADADIPGVGSETKQLLAGKGFTTAKNTNWGVNFLDGLGKETVQAIINWRNNVFINFHDSRPMDLPPEIQEGISGKYQGQRKNYAEEQQKLEAARKTLENSARETQSRLDELEPFTFTSFLRKSLAYRTFTSGTIGLGLVLSLLLLGSSATYATVRSLPTATLIPTLTFTPTNTFTPTTTPSLTPTSTPTFTVTPTQTNTPRSDFTPGSTYTPTFSLTVNAGKAPALPPP